MRTINTIDTDVSFHTAFQIKALMQFTYPGIMLGDRTNENTILLPRGRLSDPTHEFQGCYAWVMKSTFMAG